MEEHAFDVYVYYWVFPSKQPNLHWNACVSTILAVNVMKSRKNKNKNKT